MTHIIGSEDKHETKLIQHVGIVARICKESGGAELIDERVEQPKRHVTVGQATVAMILRRRIILRCLGPIYGKMDFLRL